MKAASMLRNKFSRSSESGNVFLFILLGVVLFAALAFMISRGMRSETTGAMSDREVELAAVDIMAAVQQIEHAIDRLRQKGCSEKEISYEKPGGMYNNSAAPIDKHCHVFDKAGAGMNWPLPPKNTNDGVGKMIDFPHETTGYFIDARKQYLGIGTDGGDSTRSGDLTAQLEVNKKLCQTLNKKMGGDGTIPSTSWAYWSSADVMNTPYIGQIVEPCTDGAGPYSNDGLTLCKGKNGYCRLNTDANAYYFYYVILAR